MAETSREKDLVEESYSIHGIHGAEDRRAQKRKGKISDIDPNVTPSWSTQAHPEVCFTNLSGVSKLIKLAAKMKVTCVSLWQSYG